MNNEGRVAAIIQARMGSTRFPGKVLRSLAGQPILWHITYRLKKSDSIGDIIVATSKKDDDDDIVEFCRENNINVVRGPEENVLERYRLAVDRLDPEFIVRVTGDAPLVDPDSIDRMISELVTTGKDRCVFEQGVPSIHEGFSVLTRAAFELLVENASDDPIAQEHVTGYFSSNPEMVSVTTVSVPEHEQFEARVSVDTPADLKFLERIYKELNSKPGEISVPDVVSLLKRSPKLLEINQGVTQKGLRTDTPTIFIYCEGGEEFGWGHLSRTRSVAEVLRSSYGADVRFALLGDQSAHDTLSNQEFRVQQYPGEVTENEWFDQLVTNIEPDAIVLDIRQSNLSKEAVLKHNNNDILVASIDDITETRLATDLVFYPPVPQVNDLDWSEYDGTVCADWKWTVVDKMFEPSQKTKKSDIPTIIVTMGGSDPDNMTRTSIQALQDIQREFKLIIVLGGGYQYEDTLHDELTESQLRYEIYRNTDRMAELMDRSDLAISAYGVTTFELAAMSVPSVLVCLTKDHERAARFLEQEGMAKCLGVNDTVTTKTIANSIRTLLNNPDEYSGMEQSCQQRIDNNGAKRIADRIVEELEII